MMLVHVALIVLASQAWSLDRGNNQTTKQLSSSADRAYVVKYSSLKEGMDANLTCGNKIWDDMMMFVIWKLKLKHRHCEITSNIDGRNKDTCVDGKSLRITSKAQPFLHIPNVSFGDTGDYICESIYQGGAESYVYNLSVTTPPALSAWIEWRAEKKVAVCRAERGNPAATISWSFTGNSTVKTLLDPDGLVTVESFVELDTNADADNVSCAISHPYWDNVQMIEPQPIKGFSVVYIVIIIISAVFFLALLFWALLKGKLINLRGCQKSTSSFSKSPPIEDVEEVEPYESYIQRVNSIYNSSRDLFV